MVGSDIDVAGLLGDRLVSSTALQSGISSDCALSAAVICSKNARFARKGGRDQKGLCVLDNFEFYNLRDRVVDMVGVSVDKWLARDPQSESADFAFTSEWERTEYNKISKHGLVSTLLKKPVHALYQAIDCLNAL